MKGRSLIIQKGIAILIILVMMFAKSAILGSEAISYAIDMLATNSNNVEFNAYFNMNEEFADEVEKEISAKNLKLNINVAVKNEGYFNGQIALENAGFKLSENIQNEYVEKVENNIIYLKQINAEEMAEIEIGISYFDGEEIVASTLNTETKIKLEGTYYSSKREVKINGEKGIKVKWTSPEDAKLELKAKVLTNKEYKIEEENRRIVQLLISSKMANNCYPIKKTEIETTIPEGAEVKEVHKRTTRGTNGNKEFTEANYKVEEGKLKIEVINTEVEGKINWAKNAEDIYLVTYEYKQKEEENETEESAEEKETKAEEVETEERIDIKGKVTTYEDKEIEENIEIKIEEEKDGIITIDTKEAEEEIYKGKLYAGEEREYKTYTRIYVDYAEGIKDIKVEEKTSEYLEKDEKESIAKAANIQYKKIRFNKDNIQKVLGQEWKITLIDDSNNQKEITNETETDEQGNIEINFQKDVEEFRIETSKPEKEEIIEYEVTKVIGKTEYTRDELKEITNIRDTVEVEYTKNDDETNKKEKVNEITLKETETKATMGIDKSTLSTAEEQEINLSIALEAKDETKDLYKNPEIEIVLPEQVKSVTARAKLLYGNGLKIDKESFKIEEEKGKQAIKVNLEGEQTKYSGEAENGATLIVNAKLGLEAEKDSTGDIVLNYTNENAENYIDKGQEKVRINILAQTPKMSINNVVAKTVEINDTENIKGELDVTASVGGKEIAENDEVKAGEVITYTVKVSNKGTTKIDGLDLIATIPENTKLLEINPEYGVLHGDGQNIDDMAEYFVKKDSTTIKKEDISIESGKTNTYSYMVQVNPELEANTTTKAEVSIKKQDTEIQKTEFSNKIVKGSIYIEVMPSGRKETQGIRAGEINPYGAYIYNLTDEELTNIEVTINKNDLIEFNSIEYRSNEAHNVVEKNSTTFTIDTIPAKGKATIYINAKAKLGTDKTRTAEIMMTAKDSAQNEYRSNFVSEKIEGIKLEATLEATTSENKGYITPGAEIKYTITVRNIGELNAEDIRIEDKFSDYLELKSITLNGQKCEYKTQNQFGEGVNYSLIVLNANLEKGKELKIEIIGKTDENTSTEELLKIINQASIYDEYIVLAETEEKTHFIKSIEEEPVEKEDDDDENNNDEENGNDDENNNNEDDKKDETPKFVVSGTVWKDTNSNGTKDSEEELLQGVKVYAVNTTNSQIAKDENNKEISAVTNEKGEYTLGNVPKGKYIIGFEYDTQKYKPTAYQVEGVSANKNSDAVKATKTINGESKTLAVTDSIDLTENKTDIDLGLVEIKIFNLDIEKAVSKVIVTNEKGTKTYNYKDTNLAKVEIRSKYLSGSNVLIEYTIKVTNKGEVTGYAKNIVDYIPSSLSFMPNLNTGWYKKDKYIYNESLKNTKIEPGETKEIKLVLTKTMTKSNTGLTNNKAEIYTEYNEQGIEDKEKDVGTADVLITVSTGAAFSYIAIAFVIIIAICGTVYLIRKDR